MGNDVGTVFGGNVEMPSASSLAAALKESAVKDPRSGGADGAEYLNFSGKRGLFTYGTDGAPFDTSAVLVPNIAGFEDGWVCWKGGKPIATRLANISGTQVPMPDPEENGPFNTSTGEGWFQAKAMTLKDVDTGTQYYFKINSISGVSAIASLIGQIADRAGRGEPAWPLIKLDMESFTARGYKNFKPVFHIEGWLSDEAVQEVFTNPDADIKALMGGGSIPSEGDEAPVKKQRRTL